ncbi:MAG: chromosome segregation protein SMC [Chloroflexota bacterium]|nr:chromosome segregation protein SMC [Chloroflexota bacterium]
MSSARLRGLRLTGFKSFAERTDVEFGGGISAIVGPNGSGKSNLADALRWALGEQGRSLRTRRAEDVIFAGSSSRRAIGMADVALVIDNQDRLLPIDYAEVELGRRLYRSGENEYLLNRQRVRLRDLVELLDSANLADNAFLFIGQGMVDQALALRPEERRPLFEEAAGIRRHERRRRHAEAELVEAESNMERVRDVLAELRPQARRLAAQAEQQAARRTAGTDLAQALVEAARGKTIDALRRAESQQKVLRSAHHAADAALAGLREAEEAVGRLSRALAERTEAEASARTALEAARSGTVEWRLLESRLASEVAGLERDRSRLLAERDAIGMRADAARREAAAPVPEADTADEEELRAVESDITQAERRVAELRDASSAQSERAATERRDREALTAERERLERRAHDAAGRLRELEERHAQVTATAEATDGEGVASVAAGRSAAEQEAVAEAAHEAARARQDEADDTFREAERRLAEVQGRLESTRAALGALDASSAAADDSRLLRSARARGGLRLAEGLEVEPDLRAAVEALLGDAITGVLIDVALVPALSEVASGTLVLREGGVAARPGEGTRIEAAALEAGGGKSSEAVRRDPGGAITALLARAVWVPTLADALGLRSLLPVGWRVATKDGVVVTDAGLVRISRGGSVLARQEERALLLRSLAPLEAEAAACTEARTEAATRRSAAAGHVEDARRELHEKRRGRRVADEQERTAVRTAETAAREAAWLTAQRDRAMAESSLAAEALAAIRAPAEPHRAEAMPDERWGTGVPQPASDPAAERLRNLLERREWLAVAVSARARERDAAIDRRRRAEVALSMDETRLDQVDGEVSRLLAVTSDASQRLTEARTRLAAAVAEEDRLAGALRQVMEGSGQERGRLEAVERSVADHRERLRAAEGQSRSAEVAEMEARLSSEAVREQLLVELAGIGVEGLASLVAQTIDGPEGHAGGLTAEASGLDADALPAVLESALDAAVATWRAALPLPDASPAGTSAGRLAALRRRYHDLGASNPFAAEEYAEVRQRLEALDAQRADLEGAISATRELIGQLSTLISTQFRATFAALEGAFGRRFQQLFDGGEARLSLTEPEDLSRTGVEITARPPGKKRQPLAMLSGGERALTAVALLMAMLEVRPVPFCVLDEVDAALDEANIGRFSAALRTLAEQIQFIVITHNRGTIEAADALYGVTVDDDAVSRVISLRLAELDEGTFGLAASGG